MQAAARPEAVALVAGDQVLSYETTPASVVTDGASLAVNTRLVLQPARVVERARRFADLWDAAVEPSVR